MARKSETLYVSVYKRKRDGSLAGNIVQHPHKGTRKVYRLVPRDK